MVNRNRIVIAQTQRLSLNTRLMSSIRLLGSDAEGLSRYLEEAAAQNPALIAEPVPQSEWLPRWAEPLARVRAGARIDLETLVETAGPSLQAHAEALIGALRLGPEELRIAEALAGGLEPSGWLGRPVAQIAADLGVAERAVEAVLQQVQAIAEPTGLFARNLADCLRLQAADQGWLDALAESVLARLPLVAAGAVDRIARALSVNEDDVQAVIRRIRGLDPKPGARFAACAAPVREPDLIARKAIEGWEVHLNASALPALRLSEGKGTAGAANRAEARALMRIVEGRNATLLRVAREILSRQVLALDEGIGALQPMTMAEVAMATGVNQSAVSRAVAGTAVDTPRGTWWLRDMFSQAIRGKGPAAASLREALTRMVAAEDPAHPLSDAMLAAALAGAGAPVARRTVAKYRDMLGIPPAQRRQKRDRKGRGQG